MLKVHFTYNSISTYSTRGEIMKHKTSWAVANCCRKKINATISKTLKTQDESFLFFSLSASMLVRPSKFTRSLVWASNYEVMSPVQSTTQHEQLLLESTFFFIGGFNLKKTWFRCNLFLFFLTSIVPFEKNKQKTNKQINKKLNV